MGHLQAQLILAYFNVPVCQNSKYMKKKSQQTIFNKFLKVGHVLHGCTSRDQGLLIDGTEAWRVSDNEPVVPLVMVSPPKAQDKSNKRWHTLSWRTDKKNSKQETKWLLPLPPVFQHQFPSKTGVMVPVQVRSEVAEPCDCMWFLFYF